MTEQRELPELGFVALSRYAWRQLTSMRTALILLMLMGVAAIPGSLIPQRPVNPMAVRDFFSSNPELARWYDRASLFDVYASPWFSAIYILLFISLIGCVLPRTVEHYQAMVQGPSAAWLTDNGFLAPARVLAPPGFSSAGLRKRMGDFDMTQAGELLQQGQAMGDCLTHYRQHLAGQTAIAFCCSIAHAEAVARLFQDAGIAAASIDGNTDSAKRRQLLIDLGTGKLKILTSCALIGEGVDVPSVGGCILLRPTASVGLHLQMIGRCLRPQPGKRAVVLDHVGNSLRLGHHLEPRDWTLDGIPKRDRDKAPSVKVCPQCFAAMASQAKQCGECGHTFAAEARELQQVEGELVEIQRETFRVGDLVKVNATGNQYVIGDIVRHPSPLGLHFLWKDANLYDALIPGRPDALGAWAADCIFVSRPNLKREQGTAQSMEQLVALGQQRGYKNPVAWAKHVMYARSLK